MRPRRISWIMRLLYDMSHGRRIPVSSVPSLMIITILTIFDIIYVVHIPFETMEKVHSVRAQQAAGTERNRHTKSRTCLHELHLSGPQPCLEPGKAAGLGQLSRVRDTSVRDISFTRDVSYKGHMMQGDFLGGGGNRSGTHCHGN